MRVVAGIAALALLVVAIYANSGHLSVLSILLWLGVVVVAVWATGAWRDDDDDTD